MDINALSPLASNTDSASSAASLADNFDTFLNLLTAQLQNQDPLEPLDTNQFTEQLVQFTEVEQSIAANQNLELLVALTQAASAGGAVSYLGQDIIADGAEARLDENGATWNYDLARNAETVSLTVVDSNGLPVFTTQGQAGQGPQTFTWDGRTQGGTSLPDGIYSIQINALDAAGNSIIADTTIRGTVSAVDFSGPDPLLTVNGINVSLSSIREVSTPS